MNLETWYSGKCPTSTDTFTSTNGDGVGFSDIVLLDLAERIGGAKNSDLSYTQQIDSAIKDYSEAMSKGEDEYLALNTARQKLFSSSTNGLFQGTTNLIASLFKYQPAASTSYLAHVSQNLQKHKIIPSALAANEGGVGFNTFSPFLSIWLAVRNLAYFIMVIFFIIYGFMMMLRVNLGQKTVISVQLAIPKLVVTLLIITFSYAIAGFLFDMMYVVIYLVLNYLASQKLIILGTTWRPAVAASGFGSVGLVGSFFINYLVSVQATILGVLNLVLGGTSSAIGGVLTVAFAGSIDIIIAIILMIAVLIAYVKLFVKLIGCFISLVISIITGPLTLLGNAFPGSNVIGNWFRNILANVMVFPATIILLLFSYLFMIQPIVGICTDATDMVTGLFGATQDKGTLEGCEAFFGVRSLVTSDTGTKIGNIPLITPSGGLSNFGARDLLALLGVGLLLMAPKYVDMIKDTLKVPPFKYGTAIGDALKSGWTGAGVVNPAIGGSEWYKKASETFNQKAGKPWGTPSSTSGTTPAAGKPPVGK